MILAVLIILTSIIPVNAMGMDISEEPYTDDPVLSETERDFDPINDISEESYADDPALDETESDLEPANDISLDPDLSDERMPIHITSNTEATPLQETKEDDTSIIAAALLSSGKTDSYTLEIDHSLFPDVVLMAFSYVVPGDFTITIYNENNDVLVNSKILGNAGAGTYYPKSAFTLKGQANTTYTIDITADSETVGYALAIGTEETFNQDFGKGDIITAVGKNIPDAETAKLGMTARIFSFQGLLNVGDWYSYTADGSPTFITAQIAESRSLAFVVFDAADGSVICETDANDKIIETQADGVVICYVQKRLELEAGKEYFIIVYSTSTIPDENRWSPYSVWIGLPFIKPEKVSYKSAACYVPANTTKTFSFKVSGYPESSRLCYGSKIQFNASIASYNISQCTIVAPNGQRLNAKYGRYSHLSNPDVLNYLNNPSNIPINGTWTVTVKSDAAASDFRLKIDTFVRQIVGKDGN